MPSYLITGVSRGIGYEFLRQYSSDSTNTVIGLVRNKAATDKKISEDADLKGRTNIHIFEADVKDYPALKAAAVETEKITGGSLDYIIANAGLVTTFDAYASIGELGADPENLSRQARELFEINVLGQIHLFNLFVPLLLRGEAKKAILISSGLGHIEFTNENEIETGSIYSVSKAAANMVVAKFQAQYKKDGLLFLSLSPGMVEVGHFSDASPEQLQRVGGMVEKFVKYAPHFKGPITPEESVRLMRGIIVNATVEKNGGDYISQHGDKMWL